MVSHSKQYQCKDLCSIKASIIIIISHLLTCTTIPFRTASSHIVISDLQIASASDAEGMQACLRLEQAECLLLEWVSYVVLYRKAGNFRGIKISLITKNC